MSKDRTKVPIEEILQRELYEPFGAIMNKLDEQYLTVGELLRILKITRRQLFHWDTKGLRLGRSRSSGRSWRKFSLMNVFGFALVKELLNLNLKLDDCNSFLAWLHERIYRNPCVLVRYATGDNLLLFLNTEQRVMFFVFSENDYPLLHKMERPHIVIPLHTILTNVLDYNRREDFHVEFKRVRGSTNPNEVTFYVNGKSIKFDRSLLDHVLDL